MAGPEVHLISWTDADFNGATAPGVVNIHLQVFYQGNLYAPTGLNLKVRSGDGSLATYTMSSLNPIVTVGPGDYYLPVLVGTTQAGETSYTWTATFPPGGFPTLTSSGRFTVVRAAVA